jgi:hypothetical protein
MATEEWRDLDLSLSEEDYQEFFVLLLSKTRKIDLGGFKKHVDMVL